MKPFSLLLCFISFFVDANSNKYYDIESSCRSEFDTINNSMVMGCAEAASNAAKKDMNIIYQKIHTTLATDLSNQADILEKSQIGWLQYRENWCDAQGFLIGSPMYSICRMQKNIERVDELKELLEHVKDR